MPEVSGRLADPTLRVQVYFQGVLDAGCFLYALANAYKALTGKRVTREHWNQAISLLPDPSAFLGGPGATQLHFEEAEQLIETVLAQWRDPGETFTVGRLDPTAALEDLCNEVSSASVVLFAYGGQSEFQRPDNHIVCGVAASDSVPATLHLACSTAFWGRYLNSGDYFERHHPIFGRWSNDSIGPDDKVRIAPNFRWRVTLR
ncbi:MAG: hypothetical protein ACT452_19390 [Microthrixaceae bacterium]